MSRSYWITPIILLWIGSACAEPAGIRFVENTPADNAEYRTGDLIRREIRVGVEPDYELETGLLPSIGVSVADGLEVRQVSWTREDEGDGVIYRVQLAYQLFKTVVDTEQTTAPALGLGFVAGGKRAWMEVPAWSFTQTPLHDSTDGHASIKPALPPLEYDLEPAGRVVLGLIAALLLVAGYGWLRLRFFKRLPPFAAAAKNCRRLLKHPDSAAEQAVFLALHRAVDRTAGYVLFSSGLARFLIEHPEFAGMEAEFQQFFYISDRYFYAKNEQVSDAGSLRDRLDFVAQFCDACALRET
ncbi:hypothetical protein F6R98_13125 [Candidatus Methylospira mobilis]|uniref:MxaA protein n=1 Tax=Candidatus Methylospira mobilis TaxID=1808979 RepID=A0A5Q0BHU1_9GAMM|nr:hypothetical protein [Candidatus Methylospira mobilis]QFY43445.1 hypothetical protein F6R98_13125 [Candidatus Methylospira mobilis]WNV03316.1 hypothetical protein RP726_12710 [Candidatus Methylospira mobilis]